MARAGMIDRNCPRCGHDIANHYEDWCANCNAPCDRSGAAGEGRSGGLISVHDQATERPGPPSPAGVVCSRFAEIRSGDGGYLPISCDREPEHHGPHHWMFTVTDDVSITTQDAWWLQ